MCFICSNLLESCSDLGAHIDGFIAVAAHTVSLSGGSASGPVEGQAADALQAASTALEAALRLVRPGKLISEVNHVQSMYWGSANFVSPAYGHYLKAPS